MKLCVVDRTPVIEKTLDVLRTIPLSEQGAAIRISAVNVEDIGAGADSVFLSTDVSSPFIDCVRRNECGGILVLSATSHLETRGVLRSRLLDRSLSNHNIALFGVRRWNADERLFVVSQRIQCYSMIEISREGLSEMADAVMAFVRLWPVFHIVLDFTVVDAAFAPGLSHPSPGGLSSRELLYLVQRLRLIKSLGTVNVVLDATLDDRTAQLVAQIIAELSS